MGVPSPLDLREAATRYRELGWRVVPVIGKQPRCPWKKRLPNYKIDALFDDPETTGVAVVLGSPSGNLVAMDFDSLVAFERWRDLNSELAEKLPTSRTPRPGRHVFARTAAPGKVQYLGVGEFRGGGGIVVLPPSLHHSGNQYEWLIEPFGEIPVIDPNLLLGAVEQVKKRDSSFAKAKRKQTLPTQPTPPMACVNSDKSLLIERAIDQTLPTKVGQRNQCVFQFARHLRMIFDGQTDPETLLPHVEAWHKKALANIRTKDFGETRTDFVHAWENVRWAAGATLEAIRQLAKKEPITLGLGDLNLDKVGTFFRAAATVHAARENFYMDYRTIAACVGLSHVACREIAGKLIAHGLLFEVKKGSKVKKGEATVWRWLGLPEQSAVIPTESEERDLPLWLIRDNSMTTDDSSWDWE